MNHTPRLNNSLAPAYSSKISEEAPINENVSEIYKSGFLVYKDKKIILMPTDKIAFFYCRDNGTAIVSLDNRDFEVKYSLDEVQQLVSSEQFFRLNDHYLVNFTAIKEVELYFARKLLVKLVISFTDRMLVSKDQARNFLGWLENR